MNDEIRRNLGIVCAALALVVVGVALRPFAQALGGIALASAVVVGLVGLIGLAWNLTVSREEPPAQP